MVKQGKKGQNKTSVVMATVETKAKKVSTAVQTAPVQNSSKFTSRTYNNTSSYQQPRNLSASNTGSQDFQGGCNICQKSGHKARYCPDRDYRKVCYSCGKLDRTSLTCENPLCIEKREAGNSFGEGNMNPNLSPRV